MADVLRAVTIDPVRGSAKARLDLATLGPSGGGMATLQGTLNLGAVAPQLQTTTPQRARRAPRPIGRTDGARQMGGTWRIRGSSYADAIARVEEMLSLVGDGRDGTYLEHAPWGHATKAYHRLVGPGQWTSQYNARQFNQVLGWEFGIAWPVEVDAYGLPWDVLDDFLTDPKGTDTEWTFPVDQLSASWRGLGDFGGASGTTGNRTVMLHTGRNVPPVISDMVTVEYTHGNDAVRACPVVSYVDTNNYVFAEFGGTTITLSMRRAGTDGYLTATATVTGMTAGKKYVVQLMRVAPLTWEVRWFDRSAQPMAVVSNGINAGGTVLHLGQTDAAVATFASGGKAGLMLKRAGGAVDSGFSVRSFRREPFTYRSLRAGVSADNAALPEIGGRTILFDKTPGYPGGPEHDVDLMVQPGRQAVGIGGATWALLAWGEKRRRNAIENPDTRNPLALTSTIAGWKTAATGLLTTGATVTPNATFPDTVGYIDVTTSASGQGIAYGPIDGSAIFAEINAGRKWTLSFDIIDLGATGPTITAKVGDIDGTCDWSGPSASGAINASQGFIASSTWQRFHLAVTSQFDANAIQMSFTAAGAAHFGIRNVKLYEGDSSEYDLVPVLGGHRPLGQMLGAAYVRDGGITTPTNSHTEGSVSFTAPNSAYGSGRFLTYIIDPRLLEPTEFGRPLVCEIYAELDVPSTVVSPTLRASVAPWDQAQSAGVVAAVQYSQPFGSTGMGIVKPTSGTARRTYKLGMVTLDPNDGRYGLTLEWADVPGAGGTYKLRRVVVVPVNSRASLPTGRADDSAFPDFLPGNSSANITEEYARVVFSTLASAYVGEASRSTFKTSGIGGEPISFPPGVEPLVIAWLTGEVPNDPTSDAHAGVKIGNPGMYVHARVTPRYNIAALTQP